MCKKHNPSRFYPQNVCPYIVCSSFSFMLDAMANLLFFTSQSVLFRESASC